MHVSTFLIGSPTPRVYSMTDGIIHQPGARIELQQVLELSEFDPLWAARGKAIQKYAHLESALCLLLASVSDMSWKNAVTMFYKITNTNARNSILEKLLHQKCGAEYNLFWNPFAKTIQRIDLRRNEIVHWLAVSYVMRNNMELNLTGVALVPPSSLHEQTINRPIITASDLVKFANLCDDIALLTNGLAIAIKPLEDQTDASAPSQQIFHEPFVYPLPAGHPFLKPKPISEIHPRSLPESLQFLRPTPDGHALEPWFP